MAIGFCCNNGGIQEVHSFSYTRDAHWVGTFDEYCYNKTPVVQCLPISKAYANWSIYCFLPYNLEFDYYLFSESFKSPKMYLLIYKSLPLNYYLDEVRFKSTIIRNYTYAKKGGMVQTQKHPYIPAKIVRQKERSS